MQQEPRRHHYVPQWYLRFFANERGLAVYDIKTKTLRVKSPKSVAFAEGLYDLNHPQLPRWATERLLGNIENHAAPAVRKLHERGLDVLSHDEREDIAMFLATQFLRVPAHEERIELVLRAHLDEIRADLADEEIQAATDRPLTQREMDVIRAPRPIPLDVAGMTGGAIIIYGMSLMEDLITNYEWTLVHVPDGLLITSDCPVRPRPGASGLPGQARFAVPLGPDHALILQTTGTETTPLAESIRSNLNLDVLRSADSYLFGHPDNPIWAQLELDRS